MYKFSQEGDTIPAGCVWHVEMMTSHCVHTHTERRTEWPIS